MALQPVLNLIPTPRFVEPLAAPPITFSPDRPVRILTTPATRSTFAVRFLRQHLRATTQRRVRSPRPTDIRLDLASPLAGVPASQQAYTLRADGVEPVTLAATHAHGLLHAAATLVDLLSHDPRCLRPIHIRDWPEYIHRGNSWLIHGERHGWSYARGDTPRDYAARIERKLDDCARRKINFLHFHGFDWDTDRFPGFATMMRRLNRAAKERHIRLSFGGEAAFQTGFTNRARYPDGPAYPCIGYPGDEPSRTSGTCLANRALRELFLDKFRAFVRAIRPGAIYLHSIDTGTVAQSAPIWNLRCPRCRKRWPNNDIVAPDGMAGAYASFYDAVAGALHRIEPDCLLTVVSPMYTGWDESDRDWKQACDYWCTVSRSLRDRDIHIGLREQFTNQRRPTPRLPYLRKRLDREAGGHPIATLLFFGGDNFYNGHPFLAAPVVASQLQGSHLIVTGNGTACQEPQQLLHAECLWNPHGSRFIATRAPERFDAFRRRFMRLSSGEARPRKVFGPDGFLDVACEKLYGSKAGPFVADLYRLRGRTRLGSPVFARFERTAVWMPVYHYLHPFTYSRAFRH